MDISKLVRQMPSPDGKLVILEAIQIGTKLSLLGTTIREVSVDLRQEVDDITFRAGKNKEDLVALQILQPARGDDPPIDIGVLIAVDWTKTKAPMELDKPWHPPGEVLGQIIYEKRRPMEAFRRAHIEARNKKNVVYTTNPERPDDSVKGDGDLLCRFLNEEAAERIVHQDHVEHHVRLDYKRWCGELNSEKEELEYQLEQAGIRVDRLENSIEDIERIKETAAMRQKHFRTLSLAVEQGGRWGLRARMRRLIDGLRNEYDQALARGEVEEL
jgi:hypothetical protein